MLQLHYRKESHPNAFLDLGREDMKEVQVNSYWDDKKQKQKIKLMN